MTTFRRKTREQAGLAACLLKFGHRLETVAAANGRDSQVQPDMLRMAAFVDEIFRAFLPLMDLHQLLVVGMFLAEVFT
jgi:hypothetical protein